MAKKTERNADVPENELDQLIQIMKQENLDEIEISDGDSHIKLVREPKAVAVPVMRSVASGRDTPSSAVSVQAPVEEGLSVNAPISGVFYRSPSPASPSFVKEGDAVVVGQALCIIEAMKVMNEITATQSGVIKKIKVENGKSVEANQPLFILNPS